MGKPKFFQNVEKTFAPLQNGATKFQPGHNSIQPGQLPHLPTPIGATDNKWFWDLETEKRLKWLKFLILAGTKNAICGFISVFKWFAEFWKPLPHFKNSKLAPKTIGFKKYGELLGSPSKYPTILCYNSWGYEATPKRFPLVPENRRLCVNQGGRNETKCWNNIWRGVCIIVSTFQNGRRHLCGYSFSMLFECVHNAHRIPALAFNFGGTI